MYFAIKKRFVINSKTLQKFKNIAKIQKFQLIRFTLIRITTININNNKKNNIKTIFKRN